MTRFRVAVALLAIALLVPTGFLVRRALAGVAAEEEARQRAVAERVFDEMERELTDLIAREDARPFAEYSFGGAAGDAGGGARSPLASPPELPFVVAYFQVDPDGAVRSPLLPGPAGTHEGVATRPVPEALHGFEQARDLVQPFFAATSRDEVALEDQAPAFAEKDAKRTALAKEQAAPARSPGAIASAFDAIQSLNRGAEPRAQRSRKLEVGSVPAPAAEPEAELKVASAERSDALREEAWAAPAAPVAQAHADAGLAAPRPSPAPAPAAPQSVPSGAALGRVAARAPAEAIAPASPSLRRKIRIAVDPLTGRALDAGHLLLYRTVLVGDRGYRQGLVIDVPALARWLEARALGDGRLPGARAEFTTHFGGISTALPTDPGRFRHRFAEPFDDLSLALALPPLDGGGEAGTIRALAALVAIATLAGLFALYRMVSVAVGYAERRSNFVAAVSHELKTPLTAIRMYGEMLRDGMVPTDAKREEYYRTITSESERLSRLIDNVLEFARLEKGTREMRLSAGPIGPVIEELALLLRPHAVRTGFDLHVAIEANLPPVRFERDALLQVLFNLVDNALKYARGASERVVSIECRRLDGSVELRVRDRGPGVAARQLGRVFEPFHRGEDELTRTTTGTGLGLALVKGLAERMGATVSAGNADGGGFEVRLAFPADSLLP